MKCKIHLRSSTLDLSKKKNISANFKIGQLKLFSLSNKWGEKRKKNKPEPQKPVRHY